MDRKPKRTIINISGQPQFDFEEAARSLPFTFPRYQRDVLPARIASEFIDFGIAGVFYVIFIAATLSQMPEDAPPDGRIAGIYAVGFLLLAGVYFLLFMLSASQTPGMKLRGLVVVSREDSLLDPATACVRSFGYFISIVPLMLGFIW